jgi:hypothetical protein
MIGADWQIDCREWMSAIVWIGLGHARHSVIRDQLRTKPHGFPAPLSSRRLNVSAGNEGIQDGSGNYRIASGC